MAVRAKREQDGIADRFKKYRCDDRQLKFARSWVRKGG